MRMIVVKIPALRYDKSMEVEINPRGNGACPICNLGGSCRIQNALLKAMAAYSSTDNPMEIVVYSCPQFEEKD